jgi:hypothetical protein
MQDSGRYPSNHPSQTKQEYDALPPLLEAEIMAPGLSPWDAQTKYSRKANGTLRVVHQYEKNSL